MIYIIVSGCSLIVGMLTMDFLMQRENRNTWYVTEIRKTRYYLRIMAAWVDMLQHKTNLTDYLRDNGYEKIAIYGMRDLGERLYHELKLGGIEPVCVIDRGDVPYGELPIYKPQDELPELDLIIVTAEYYLEDIRKDLSKHNVEVVGISAVIGNAFGRNIC